MSTTLAGEPFPIFPPEGAVLGVVGVAHDDVLNLRTDPGLTAIVGRLGPLDHDVVSLGEGWKLPTTIWWKVEAADQVGWVNSRYVMYLGPVDDVTSRVVELLGSYPSATKMEDLGRTIAETLGVADPLPRIVMTARPTVGDLGEVTFDVIGLADDAIGGVRLHVFGALGGGGFVLKAVEQTVLCLRSPDCA